MIASFAGMRSAVEREISERRKAEEESSVANAHFRFLVEQSLVGFYILQDGKVAYAQRNAEFAAHPDYDAALAALKAVLG